MAQQDVIDLPKLFLSFALGVFVTITMIIGAQALYLWGQEVETDNKDLAGPPREITKVMSEADAGLQASAVVTTGANGAPEKVTIPIDRAIDYVIRELKGN